MSASVPLTDRRNPLSGRGSRYVFGVCLVVLALALGSTRAHAENQVARALTDQGLSVMAVGVVANSFTEEGKQNRTLVNCVEAATVTALAVDLLKPLVGEERPRGGSLNSFPSGHAATAFTVATVLAENHPRQKWYWYGLAAAISWSRVDLRAHHTHDVVAGAALGHLIAREVLAYNDCPATGEPGVVLFHTAW